MHKNFEDAPISHNYVLHTLYWQHKKYHYEKSIITKDMIETIKNNVTLEG